MKSGIAHKNAPMIALLSITIFVAGKKEKFDDCTSYQPPKDCTCYQSCKIYMEKGISLLAEKLHELLAQVI